MPSFLRWISLISAAAAGRGDLRLVLSVINLGEVLYLVERNYSPEDVQAILAAILVMPIEVLPASQERGAAILTGDPEIREVEGVTVEWVD